MGSMHSKTSITSQPALTHFGTNESEAARRTARVFEYDGLSTIDDDSNEEYSEYDGMTTQQLASSIAHQIYEEMPLQQKMMSQE